MMEAGVPMEVPSTNMDKGSTAIIRIKKGTLRSKLMTALSRVMSQPGSGRTPSFSPATSSAPRGRPTTMASKVEMAVA